MTALFGKDNKMTVEHKLDPESIEESVDTLKAASKKKVQDTVENATSDRNVNRFLVFTFGVLAGMAIANTMNARRPIQVNVLPTSQIPMAMWGNH
jgi:hypothetical protein|nr:MAG TPA: hypothetical protein [Caudoviricetes sp.]